MTKDLEMIQKVYDNMSDRHQHIWELTGRSLTLAEKILYAHLAEIPQKPLKRGEDYALLSPDRVAMQDATAQMALLQFMQAGKDKTAVPTTVHCDHLIQAELGSTTDLERAKEINQEVYDFLESVSKRYGIGYWEPGAGIIHQIVLENYAFPGGMMIGTDSHTPNAGGMGMIAIGVGGADAVDVMAGMPWELKWPKIIGVKLSGELKGWAAPKDIILRLLGILSVKGGTGAVVEYFGEGTQTLSATAKATITNMGAELGATCSIFPYDESHAAYLEKTGRGEVANMARNMAQNLMADADVYENPEQYYDKVLDIDLSELEPHLNGPFTPDKAWLVSKMKKAIKDEGYPEELSSALIGSCTNASYEDLTKASELAKSFMEKGLKAKSNLYISPGSDMVRKTLEQEGKLQILQDFGAVILANACGPCIGQWNRTDMPMGKKNSIVHSFNRNFRKRADGNPETNAFVASPELTMVLAAAGRITFNPNLEDIDGIVPQPPEVEALPEQFEDPDIGLIEPPEHGKTIQVKVDPESERLQLLEPFPAWDGNDLAQLAVLFKAKGKCTTDHISMAGQWLKFRGHLDNISNNLLIGGTNAFTGEVGNTVNIFTGIKKPVPDVARDYKNRGISWVIIGDENYGEGSSREHAAMEPRHLGGMAVIVRSFARIHETNLKKQGMLALTFDDPSDYNIIRADDRLTIMGLNEFAPGKPLFLVIKHSDGSEKECKLNHTYSPIQIEWFKAGSALNMIAAQNQ